MGDTGPKIEAAVQHAENYREGSPEILYADSMEKAVELARAAAREGDVISMSPASASFDMYKNFEERGRHFKEIVNALN